MNLNEEDIMDRNDIKEMKDPNLMAEMFSSIASNYDRTNLCISLGLCKLWNRCLVKKAVSEEAKNYLDLCCGTGEIAFNLLKAQQKRNLPLSNTLLVDVAPKMVDLCKKRFLGLFEQTSLTFLQQDAHRLTLEKESLDLITIAYGVRNLQHLDKVLLHLNQALKKGGRLMILELSNPSSPLIRKLHTLYLKVVIPLLGWLGTSKKEPYSYLQKSVREFVSPKILIELLEFTGFSRTSFTPLTFGSAFILEVIK